MWTCLYFSFAWYKFQVDNLFFSEFGGHYSTIFWVHCCYWETFWSICLAFTDDLFLPLIASTILFGISQLNYFRLGFYLYILGIYCASWIYEFMFIQQFLLSPQTLPRLHPLCSLLLVPVVSIILPSISFNFSFYIYISSTLFLLATHWTISLALASRLCIVSSAESKMIFNMSDFFF